MTARQGSIAKKSLGFGLKNEILFFQFDENGKVDMARTTANFARFKKLIGAKTNEDAKKILRKAFPQQSIVVPTPKLVVDLTTIPPTDFSKNYSFDVYALRQFADFLVRPRGGKMSDYYLVSIVRRITFFNVVTGICGTPLLPLKVGERIRKVSGKTIYKRAQILRKC